MQQIFNNIDFISLNSFPRVEYPAESQGIQNYSPLTVLHPINTMWLVRKSIIIITQSCFVGFLSGPVESSQLI